MILNDCVSLQVLCLFFWHTFGSIVFLDIGWKAELLKFLLWMGNNISTSYSHDVWVVMRSDNFLLNLLDTDSRKRWKS